MNKHHEFFGKKRVAQFIEWSAWVGVFLVLGSYFLLATGLLRDTDWLYHAMILVGSAFLGIIAYVKNVFQSVFLNAVFVTLAIIALVRLAIQSL